jgi:hypothetical protein
MRVRPERARNGAGWRRISVPDASKSAFEKPVIKIS